MTTSSRFVNQFARIFHAQWLPWLLMFALFSAGLTANYAYQHPTAHRSVIGWALGIVAIFVAALRYDALRTPSIHVPASRSARYQLDSWDWLWIVTITVLALSLRLYRLESHFPPMHGDEGEKGILALVALNGPDPQVDVQPVPLFGARFFGHPTLYFYMQAVALRLLGETLEALRTMNALFGALAAGLLYFLGRMGWGRWAGFTAGWLMAVSHTYIHYSRTAMSMIPTAFAIVLMVTLFAAAYERARVYHAARQGPYRNVLLFVGIGLTIGWSQYMYYGSRLLPVLAFVLVVYLLLQRHMTWRQLVAMGLGFLVIYLPQGYYFFHHPDVWLGRLSTNGGSANGLSASAIQRVLGPDAIWPTDLPRYLWRQIIINARYFVDKGDGSSFYWRQLPGFDPVTVLLLWSGLLLAIGRLPRYHEFVAATWSCLGVFLAGVLTIDSPYGPRLLIAMPAIFLLAGMVVQLGVGWVHDHWSRWRSASWLFVSTIAVVTLAINYQYYFVRYAQFGPVQVPELAARALLAEPEPVRAYFLTAPQFYQYHGNIRFLAHHISRYDIAEVAEFARVKEEDETAAHLIFIAIPDRRAELVDYEKRFPGGVEEEIVDHYDQVRLITYVTPLTE
ncbi:MAG: glycosyltransferase family 39 protein [Caldilineaceae bacterium]